MSNTWAIQHFRELELTLADFDDVTEDAIALFSISSYAVSELNAIARVLLSTLHPLEKDDAINIANVIQSSCIIRYWTLKLFEFFECLKKIQNSPKRYDDHVVRLAAQAVDDFSTLKSQSGFMLARDVRHEATGHYSLDAAKKNLRHVGRHATASMFVHQNSVNSFFPLGEEVMFIGRLNRHGVNLSSDAERAKLIQVLFDWNMAANKWIGDTHLAFFRALILPKLDGRYAKKRAYWMNPRKVGAVEEFNVPLFAVFELGQSK